VTLTKLRGLKFGYVPYRGDANSPGDRRRFVAVANALGLDWEIYAADQQYDVLVLTSNADLPKFHRAGKSNSKIVFDMADSYLDLPWWDVGSYLRGAGKWLLRRHSHLELPYQVSVRRICQKADVVVCNTPEQVKMIEPFNARCFDILDCHDEIGSGRIERDQEAGHHHLFWEGISLTSRQFSLIRDVLEDLSKRFSLTVHLVTDLTLKPVNLPFVKFSTTKQLSSALGKVDFTVSQWHPRLVRAIASHCDLGLIPIDHKRPLYRAKPENKLCLMWRLGLPVVASATPAYARVMEQYEGPDWSCQDEADWHSHLTDALGSRELRLNAAVAGQEYALQAGGLANLLPKWERALGELVR
jgi:hypothetical protein